LLVVSLLLPSVCDVERRFIGRPQPSRHISTHMAMLGRFLQCCNTQHDIGPGSELKVVQLSSDVLDHGMERPMSQPVHLLTHQDSFDMTVTPRNGCKGERRIAPVTPRQKNFKERIRLPKLRRYPVPPGCTNDDPEDHRIEQLLNAYQEFVLDLHKGIHMTQLTSNQDYSDIHCQILEDLQTLKVDQGSGCIIEFPLSAVSKVYRIVKNDDKWYSAGSLTGPTPMPPLPLSNAEHIVVVEFMRRKLAFVFTDMAAAQRFLMCIELLIRRAQETRSEVDSLGFRSRPKHEGNKMAPMFSGYNREGLSDRLSGRIPPSKDSNAGGGQLCTCQPQGI